jgi:hypothetical protein
MTISSTSVAGGDSSKSSNPLEGTFHRRQLPPPSVAFGSSEGRQLFAEALTQGYMSAYFNLAEHFSTQGHPSFCGLGSLTMALNALFVDPGRVWQGVWRWFDESMLDCCDPLEVVKLQGITVAKLSCLARCNGAKVSVKYGDAITLEEFREDVKRVCSQSPHHFKDSHCAKKQGSEQGEEDHEHKAVVMIASYSRRILKQSGSGHFSPIGGFHTEKDMVLIMDVARFKYPPHWVPLKVLFDAFQPIDPDAGKCRGYMLLSATDFLYAKCHCSDPVKDKSTCGEERDDQVKVCCSKTNVTVTESTDASDPVAVTTTLTSSNAQIESTVATEDAVSVSHPLAPLSLQSILEHKCEFCGVGGCDKK